MHECIKPERKWWYETLFRQLFKVDFWQAQWLLFPPIFQYKLNTQTLSLLLSIRPNLAKGKGKKKLYSFASSSLTNLHPTSQILGLSFHLGERSNLVDFLGGISVENLVSNQGSYLEEVTFLHLLIFQILRRVELSFHGFETLIAFIGQRT